MTVAPERDRIDAIDVLGRSFKSTMASLRRLRGRETHRPGDVSYSQYTLLFGLGDGGALSARELADRAELSPASVTEMLDGLAAAGLVERIRSDRDKRVVLTSLTERGSALVAEHRAKFDVTWRGAMGEFSDEQLLSAAAVLDRLRTMFDEFGETRVATHRDQAID
jgi:DNA-binding MarR family transcriptional regulator